MKDDAIDTTDPKDLPVIAAPFYFVGATGLFLLWWVSSFFEVLAKLDQIVTAHAYNWCKSHRLKRAGWWGSRLGDGWMYAGVYLLLRHFGELWRARELAEAVLLAWGAAGAVKLVARRKRWGKPGSGSVISTIKWVGRISHWSFPSQHSAVAVAAAGAVGGPAAWVVAGVIAVSRVVSGAHYLGDVLAGCAVGLIVKHFMQ